MFSTYPYQFLHMYVPITENIYNLHISISCSTHVFLDFIYQFLLQVEAAARRHGYQVKRIECELATDPHEHPLESDYVWEHDEDLAHEKQKVLARFTQELDLSSINLQATAVFAKNLDVVSEMHLFLERTCSSCFLYWCLPNISNTAFCRLHVGECAYQLGLML